MLLHQVRSAELSLELKNNTDRTARNNNFHLFRWNCDAAQDVNHCLLIHGGGDCLYELQLTM